MSSFVSRFMARGVKIERQTHGLGGKPPEGRNQFRLFCNQTGVDALIEINGSFSPIFPRAPLETE